MVLTPQWQTQSVDEGLDQHWVEEVLVRVSKGLPIVAKPMTKADRLLVALKELETSVGDMYYQSNAWKSSIDVDSLFYAIESILDAVGSRQGYKLAVSRNMHIAWVENAKDIDKEQRP